VSDGEASSVGTAIVTIIPGPNDVPETEADAYVVLEDGSLSVGAAGGVLGNDTDPDDDQFTAELISNVAHGTLELAEDGSFEYVPAPDFFGSDGFVYRAVDPLGASVSTPVTIAVTGVNDVPLARPDTFIIQPGQTLNSDVLENDEDADGDQLSAVIVFDESQGDVNLASDGSLSYDPGGFTGSTQFFYLARDASTSSPDVQVSLIVNGQPTALADGYTVVEDEALTVSPPLGLLRNDSDPEGSAIAAIKTSDVSDGVLALAADGSFVYTPNPDFSGVDSFSYVVSDGLQTSQVAGVTISVQAVNDLPAVGDDDYRVVTNYPITINAAEGVLGNDTDADGDTLTVSLVSDVANGALSLDPDGAFIYTPAQDFEGDDSFVYQARDLSTGSTGTVTLRVGPDLDSVVINEIMYHPQSDNDLEEYIELTNIGENPVDLDGWRFGSGVDFTFPAVTLSPGEFLVVAADRASFEAAYGVVGSVVGGWTGRLSNSGERVRLYESGGIEVDDVSYSDEGDWTRRERVSNSVGWDWNSDHDGAGQSLELRFPGLSNKHGQNWGASQEAPTPGAANTLASDAIAPMILDVAHSPVVPRSNQPVQITARLLDVEETAFSASLFWRLAPRNPGAFAEVAMADDGASGDGEPGDGVYGATLPASPDGTIVEFYVAASDGAASRTWPAETNIGQVANAHYQVDDETPPGHWPIYRIVMTGDEDEAWVDVNRSSNERFHATLLLDDCSGPVIRYNASLRVRGAGSRSHNPPPMRVSLPHDQPWNDRTAMNWNTKYTYLQYVGMRLFQGSGMAAPDGKPMRVRWNGEDRMRSDAFDYGLAIHMEVLDGEFIDDKFPDDNDGNLYKKTRPDNDWAYRDGDASEYLDDGWSKETNAIQNDWSDLDQWLGILNNAPGSD
ncbi:MAG: Ig-like domain-containing protein, partial [Verrucomicrobiales bacterium]